MEQVFLLFFLLGLATSQSSNEQDCPAVWSTISEDLASLFVSGNQCSTFARVAIRYAFHDAGTFSTKVSAGGPASGGADGSLLLSDEEIGRTENDGLENYHSFIKRKFDEYRSEGVGAADLVQFAANVGIVSCPGGPTVQTLVGREDSSDPAPEDLLPKAFGAGSDHDTIYQLFLDKGISAGELAALIGAHSVSRATAQPELRPGTPQDSTPGTWDVEYYSNVYKPPPGIGRFESDINLSDVNTTVGEEFETFVDNQGGWTSQFAPAMFRLSLLGISTTKSNNFTDCTSALPQSRTTRRRSLAAAAAAAAAGAGKRLP